MGSPFRRRNLEGSSVLLLDPWLGKDIKREEGKREKRAKGDWEGEEEGGDTLKC